MKIHSRSFVIAFQRFQSQFSAFALARISSKMLCESSLVERDRKMAENSVRLSVPPTRNLTEKIRSEVSFVLSVDWETRRFEVVQD
jgi:hypothetical protein